MFVGNLSFDVTREELVEAFGAVGRVVDAKVPTDRETGRPRGFAFVEFENDEAVQKCIEQMNGRDLKGRAMRVNAAEDRPPRPAGAPGGGFSRARRRLLAARRRRRRLLQAGGGGGGFSRPGGSFRPGAAPTFPPPEETGPDRGRRFKQKPESKPVRKTSPRRRRDDIVDDDDADY